MFLLHFCSHPITKQYPCACSCCSSSHRASFGRPASLSRGSSKIIFTAIHLFNHTAASSGKYQCDICSVVNAFPPRVTCFLLFDVLVGAVVQCHLDLQAYQVRMSGCAARTALPDERLMAGYPIMANLSRFWVLNPHRFIFSKPEDSNFVNRITHTKFHIQVFIIHILYLYLSRNQSNSVVVGFNKVNILTFKNINLMRMLYLCNYTWYSCEVSQGVRRRRQR